MAAPKRAAGPMRESTIKRRAPWKRAEPTPEELAVRAQRGSVAAYSELVRLFEGRLYNFLLRRVGSAADAEDLAQEAFLRAWQRIGTYRPKWRFSTWLFTIASRLAISQARRASVNQRPIREDMGSAAEAPIDAREDEPRPRIWTLVGESLGPDQQTAVWLRYVEDMAIGDIARVMGRSQVSVRVMLFRARGILAERLGREPAMAEEVAQVVRLPRRVAERGARC